MTFSSVLLFFAISGVSQDYIISWDNDTTACILPDKPWKDGLRPSGLYDNGHIRTVAIFTNDSLAVIEPGKVKGYYREKHGRRYLCDGYFVSRKINDKTVLNFNRSKKYRSNEWGFMQPLVTGKYASLYRMYARGNRIIRPYYLVARHDFEDPLHTVVIWTRKDAYKLLSDTPIKERMEDYRKSTRKQRFSGIVQQYNNLMEQHHTKNAASD